MNFDSKTQSVIGLPFESSQTWPAHFPAFVWGGVIVAGQSPAGRPQFHFSESRPIEEVLHSCYPKLTWFEVLKLILALDSVQLQYSVEILWGLYGFRLHPDDAAYKNIFSQLPLEFQNWLIQKDFGPRDLAPLKSLPNLSVHQEFFVKWPRYDFSKSDGQRALEWWVDLTLQGHPDINTLCASTEHGPTLLERLEELRYPLAAQQKKSSQNLLKKLPWPRRLQARVTRMGDLSGFEVKFFAQNQNEFKKHIEGLEAVSRQLTDEKIERF